MNTPKHFSNNIRKALLKIWANKTHEEYLKIKTLHLTQFIKISLGILMFSALYFLIVLTIKKQYCYLPWLAVILAFCSLSWMFCNQLKKYINIIFFILCIVQSAYGYYLIDKFPLHHVASTFAQGFLQGNTFGIYEKMISLRFSSFFYKISFSLILTITKLVLLHEAPIEFQIFQVFIIFISLAIEFIKEKEDRRLFQDFHDHRENLTKFKKLVSSGLSANVLILTKDLKEQLFISDPLNEMTKTGPQEWLNHLIIEKQTLKDNTRSNSSITQNEQDLSVLAVLKEIKNKTFFLRSQQKLAFNARIQEKIFEIKIFGTIWDDKDSLVLILNDITDHYMNICLQVADRNKDKMLAMISHELRTPLNGILGVVNILKKDIKEPQQLRYLTVCHNSGELLLNLVNSILDLQQIRDNKFSLNFTKDDLGELLGGIYDLFKFQFDQKDLFLKFEVSQSVPEQIITDKNRLKQILINLIGNALKVTFKGGVRVFVGLDPNLTGFIHFQVTDTGPGIKEDDVKKLFTHQQGVGLGLEISNQLAILLAGDQETGGLKVESQIEQGTTFSFSIKDNSFNTLNSEESHEINYYEPKVFSEDIEDIGIKITPYSHRDIFTNDRTSPPPMITGLASTAENLIPKIFMPSVSLWSTQRYSDSANQQNLINNFTNNLAPHRSFHNFQRSRGTCSSSYTTPKEQSFSDFSPVSPLINQSFGLLPVSSLKHKILLVDDNPFNLLVARHIVERLGYEVETALNGELAIEKARTDDNTQPFSAILMDLQMPVMNGFEATKELKRMMENREIANIPIIAVSANDSTADRKKCEEAGIYTHLSKPLDEELLRKVLEKILEKDFMSATFGKIDRSEVQRESPAFDLSKKIFD